MFRGLQVSAPERSPKGHKPLTSPLCQRFVTHHWSKVRTQSTKTSSTNRSGYFVRWVCSMWCGGISTENLFKMYPCYLFWCFFYSFFFFSFWHHRLSLSSYCCVTCTNTQSSGSSTLSQWLFSVLQTTQYNYKNSLDHSHCFYSEIKPRGGGYI